MHLIVTTNQEMEEYYTIFWMSQLRHREVERLARIHTAVMGAGWGEEVLDAAA